MKPNKTKAIKQLPKIQSGVNTWNSLFTAQLPAITVMSQHTHHYNGDNSVEVVNLGPMIDCCVGSMYYYANRTRNT